jgi:dTMP kinase
MVAPTPMSRGTLITIEGIDGAGKTTLAEALRRALEARGVDVALLREPGGVPAAERIRALVKDPDLTLDGRAEALLYAAARAQLVEEGLKPLLARGTTVLLDRFVDSSLVYQGVGRWLGIDAVREINAFATGGLVPERTLLVAIDPALARARSRARGAPPDRLEREDEDFFARIAAAYGRLSESEPERVRTIDGAQDPETMLARALAEIADLV